MFCYSTIRASCPLPLWIEYQLKLKSPKLFPSSTSLQLNCQPLEGRWPHDSCFSLDPALHLAPYLLHDKDRVNTCLLRKAKNKLHQAEIEAKKREREQKILVSYLSGLFPLFFFSLVSPVTNRSKGQGLRQPLCTVPLQSKLRDLP